MLHFIQSHKTTLNHANQFIILFAFKYDFWNNYIIINHNTLMKNTKFIPINQKNHLKIIKDVK